MAAQGIFGTDGVRGEANRFPVDAETALRLGLAAASIFDRQGGGGRAVIGKDTRLSGYMLESALQAGFTAGGMDVHLLGPLPTPAVAMLTRSMRADVGVMISASHNPYRDNGIKLFGPDGFKLSDAQEARIEAAMAQPPACAPPDAIGRARRVQGGLARYVEVAKSTLPRQLRLGGMKIVVDCAHGAAYRAAPDALWELGAEVIAIGVAPDGRNINDQVGSTAPEACRRAVIEHGADLGVALDGDADRVHLIDERGMIADGDQLMALIAERWASNGRLRGGAVAATVMSNLGLERHLAGLGLGLIRARVGDRYVLEAMRAHGLNVGGEQSGHVILTDFSPTGDGLIAALQAMAGMAERGEPASRALRRFEPAPQTLRSVRFTAASPLEAPGVREALRDGEARLGASGRLVVRPSGTEPVIRVMAEGDDAAVVDAAVRAVCDAISAAT